MIKLPAVKLSLVKLGLVKLLVRKLTSTTLPGFKTFTNALASLLMLNCFLSALAWGDDADLLLDVLQQHSSMQAQFEQSVKDVDGREVQASKGLLKVQKPKQFLWRTSEPFEQEIVSNGEKMWVFDVDLDQLTIQPVDQQWDSTPALLLIGDEQEVRKNFSIKLLTKVVERLTFDVLPLATESAYKKLELIVEDEQVVAMSFTDHLGQISSIRFTEIVVGKTIASSEFTIVPAPGVDVIDYYEDAALQSDSEFDSERIAHRILP